MISEEEKCLLTFASEANYECCMYLSNRGGTGLGPSPTRSRPSRFFELLRVFEPEGFESGLGPTWPESVKPEPEKKSGTCDYQ